jgi:hypothetical protein
VRNPQSLWGAFQLAKTYGCRPSELFGIDVQPTAYYFDRAIGIFGVHLENELSKAEAGGKSKASKTMKRNMVLARYLGAESAKFAGPRGGRGG